MEHGDDLAAVAALMRFLRAPSFSRPLAHPIVWSIAQSAASEIGYRIL
ncbi:hypothetical protein JCM12141A_02380 [Mycolicibacterium hodleri]